MKPITSLRVDDPAIARERLEMVGGRFEIKAVPGQDTTVEARDIAGAQSVSGGAERMDLARNEP
jgi:hypothetical protein